MSRHDTRLRRSTDIVVDDFEIYLNRIIHEWSKTLTALAYTLVPIFFILDYFIMPSELLPRFGVYRLASTLIVLVQAVFIRRTKPSRWSYIHGYLVSINVGGMIALMTVDLGGFDSSYYAGLNLVLIGVNLLLPWHAIHSAANSLIIIAMYVCFNLIAAQEFGRIALINNLFFLCSTAVIAVSINHVKHRLVKQEFNLLVELKRARDALWSEMELAKRIQTALLPDKKSLRGLEVAAVMYPAKMVGGDYYDILETPAGEKWVIVGDVSGHGVDSGLIMMMAQTSALSMVSNSKGHKPSEVLAAVNAVLRENLSRMGSDHYMTMMVIRLGENEMILAGKHQNVLIFRASLNKVEVVPTTGTWLGIVDDVQECLEDVPVRIGDGDLVLLFTDGITEATSERGEMYGQERLEQALSQYADLPVGKLLDQIISQVEAFQSEQMDDMTLVVIKKPRAGEQKAV